MQLSQPTLESHSLCYTCWVQVVYSLLPTLLLFLLGILYCCLVPTDVREFTRSYQEYENFEAFVPQSTSLWRPIQLPTRVIVYVLRFRILCIKHFVINVINNIRNRFIISFMWYVLWYIVHYVVYTCDLTPARIWLLDLCPFINRLLQYVKHMGHNRNRLYSRAIHSPTSMEKHYVQWFILKSV